MSQFPGPSKSAPAPLSSTALVLRFGVIGAIVCAGAAAFAYAGGWFSPARLTPSRLIETFQEVNGFYPGFRRNHAKGICFSGHFESNGQGADLSKASLFAPGRVTPVTGRFALAGGQPYAADAETTVRSMAVRFRLDNGEEWRTGMNDIPVFAVNTPEAFRDQLLAGRKDPATGKPDPAAMAAFLAAHPETARAAALIKARSISSGFDDDTYNGLNTFLFVNSAGVATPVRWSMVPIAPFISEEPEKTVKIDKDFLFVDLINEAGDHPLQWRLVVMVGKPGDPTMDATLPWPSEREHRELGSLTIESLQDEADGRCRDVNFDPLILPQGIEASDDPLLSARSAVYSQSFTRREGEPKTPSAVMMPNGTKGDKS
ncbi:catalase family peroxidase [Beijerinckia indica]|uniref:Catalase-related peroxidase n=1 Tax=Beijerinckia indica subsp. indica (strain ATCC 9039 / DSM 1715 / NCIMB 8712) TaxID=395963 RepID=B2IJP0_BEII9|nr:catalase family peroxidase [Beijerinckia indica]ACB94912.1 Catalase domain protein [Beijerinckia indica subsp. indica ATCC 9039]